MATLVMASTFPETCLAQHVVLKDFSTTEAKITRFDAAGIQLADGSLITWDQVHDAEVADSEKPQFENFKQQIGIPLLRVKRRLTSRDDLNLLQISTELAERLDSTDSLAEYIAHSGRFYGLIAEGRREEAVIPLLRCLRIEAGWSDFPDQKIGRPVQVDQRGINRDLLPLWFDEQAAAATWKQLADLDWVSENSSLAVIIYSLSLARAGGVNDPHADQRVATLQNNEPFRQSVWSKIIQSQQLIQQSEFLRVREVLPKKFDQIEPPEQCAILYYKGVAGLRSTQLREREGALLDLLQVPASWGAEFPEVAAACLYIAINSDLLQGKPGSVESLKRELIQKYSRTIHASKIRELSESRVGTPDR